VNGASIEVRLCAEIPEQNFMPSVGLIKQLQWPQQDFLRIDAGYAQGNVLSPYYDSLLAKIIVHGNDRVQAVQHLREAMNSLYIEGIQTNQDWLVGIIHQKIFLQDTLTTDYLDQYQVDHASQFPSWLAPALIAIYQHSYAQPGASNNPWYQSVGYSVIQKPQTHMIYQNDQAIEITINQKESGLFAISQHDDYLAELQINQPSNKILSFTWQDKSMQAHVFLSDNHITLRLLGEVFQYQRYPISDAVATSDHSGELTAPLPGSVVKVLVKQGDAVKKGDRLLIMEAMKMEHPLIAPFDGVIESIHAQQGDRVALGNVLVIVS
jgi:3-methylcrotonyl-CoA carboxylase alpha subunit